MNFIVKFIKADRINHSFFSFILKLGRLSKLIQVRYSSKYLDIINTFVNDLIIYHAFANYTTEYIIFC